MKTKHFTLIKLLVVIAIIAILASMLLPALGKAKSRAVSIKCTGKLKELATIRLICANDYNDFFIISDFGASRAWLYYRQQGYLKNEKVTACDWDGHKSLSDGYYTYGAKGLYGPASINAAKYMITVTNANNKDARFTHLSKIKHTSEYIQDADSIDSSLDKQSGAFNITSTALNTYGRFYFAHGNKLNANFIDGHSENMSVDRLQHCMALDYADRAEQSVRIHYRDSSLQEKLFRVP